MGTTVTLRWTDSSGNEAGFYIDRRTKGGQFARIATLGANVTTFAETRTKGQYDYRVQAYQGTIVSSYSNTASARVR